MSTRKKKKDRRSSDRSETNEREIWTRQRRGRELWKKYAYEKSPRSKGRSEWVAMKQGTENREQEFDAIARVEEQKERRKLSQEHASAKYRKASENVQGAGCQGVTVN